MLLRQTKAQLDRQLESEELNSKYGGAEGDGGAHCRATGTAGGPKND